MRRTSGVRGMGWVFLVAMVTLEAGPLEAAFRFLTSTVPEGWVGRYYHARIVTANADGSVTFGVSGGSLPGGLALDSATGILAGTPTADGTSSVTIQAEDRTSTIDLSLDVTISDTGTGPEVEPGIANSSLSPGRIGEEYEDDLVVANGTGPFILTADTLPPGLLLNGETGALSGTPRAAGTFHVCLTVTDLGAPATGRVKSLPLLILPTGSDMQFATVLLDNGEVGTPYSDELGVVGAPGGGGVRYTATGLPPGLTLDKKGDLAGTPTMAGTFVVRLMATKGEDRITTSLPVFVARDSISVIRRLRRASAVLRALFRIRCRSAACFSTSRANPLTAFCVRRGRASSVLFHVRRSVFSTSACARFTRFGRLPRTPRCFLAARAIAGHLPS